MLNKIAKKDKENKNEKQADGDAEDSTIIVG